MAMWTVVLKNLTASDIRIEDLGIDILSGSSLNAHNQYSYNQLTDSENLKTLIQSGDIILNNGSDDLIAGEAIKYLSEVNKWYVDNFFFTKQELSVSGAGGAVHWDNVTNKPALASPKYLKVVSTKVVAISATPPTSPSINDTYFNTSDTNLYRWNGSSWVLLHSVELDERVIDLSDSAQEIKNWNGSSFVATGEISEGSVVTVNDDGDGKAAQYVYDGDTSKWEKWSDVDFDEHFDGGTSKHDASEIDVEGTYSNIPGTPTDLESTISAIDSQFGNVNTITNALSAAIQNGADASGETASILAAHLDGGAGKHDANEIDVEGTYDNFSGTNVESVFGSIDDKFDAVNNAIDAVSLDSAYDGSGAAGSGKNITVDAGAVKLDASSSTYSPIELTPVTNLPTTGLSGGQLAVKDGILCIYDSSRAKWLSVQRVLLTFGRQGNTANQYLNLGVGSLPSNNSGFRLARNATVVSMTAQVDSAISSNQATFQIRKNDQSTAETSLNVAVGTTGSSSSTTNIDLYADDQIQAYLAKTSGSAEDPVFVIELAWRV